MKDYDFEESGSSWGFFLFVYAGVIAAGAAVVGGLSLIAKMFQ